MFAQCKWIIIYNIVILFLYCDICATNAKNEETRFAGVVENITVYALKDKSYLGNDDMLKSLKLNISWMPPNKGKQPSSYSIAITCISNKTDINDVKCIESTAFYNVQNRSPLSLLVPQNKLQNDMSEIQIRPNCIYKVQVYANPRAKSIEKLPEVVYTVPKCIERSCSCVDAKATLPIPKVEVIQIKENVVINWNATSNSSYIQSYVISIGIPVSTSKAGYYIYDITKIRNVTSTTNTFTWDLKINDRYVKMKNGYKILVEAIDHQGCSGTQGSFVFINIEETETLDSNIIIWLLLVGVAICVILGFISIVLIYNKIGYQIKWSFKERKKTTLGFSAYKLIKWPNLIESNIGIYVKQKKNSKETQNNEFEVPYKCINLICELGKGQFGTVHLGRLNNNKDTLVAVKMLQCSDAPDEARHQLLEEIKIMKTAGSHPHLVSLVGCCTLRDNPTCILLEYMEGGDLLAYLHSRRKFELDDISLYCCEKMASKYVNIIEKSKNKNEDLYSEIDRQQFLKFALDIARGMEHLEARNITHRDLAARNILLTSDLTLKISDFGLSRNGIYVISNIATKKVCRLPIRWMSPEAIRDLAFSSKSDVWSFSVVLWEIGTLGSIPYASIHDDILLHYLIHDKCRLACPNSVSHDIYKIMCSCWNAVPQNRPNFAQLVLDLQTLKEPLHSTHKISNTCYTLL